MNCHEWQELLVLLLLLVVVVVVVVVVVLVLVLLLLLLFILLLLLLLHCKTTKKQPNIYKKIFCANINMINLSLDELKLVATDRDIRGYENKSENT